MTCQNHTSRQRHKKLEFQPRCIWIQNLYSQPCCVIATCPARSAAEGKSDITATFNTSFPLNAVRVIIAKVMGTADKDATEWMKENASKFAFLSPLQTSCLGPSFGSLCILGSSFHPDLFVFSDLVALYIITSRDFPGGPVVKTPCCQFKGYGLNPGIDLGEAGARGGEKQDLNSLSKNWTWVAWMKTRNPSRKTSKG